MTGERLELVRSFDELRAGVIIVLMDCEWCGGAKHRGMLTIRNDGPNTNGEVTNAWEFLPLAICGTNCVEEDDVSDGDVFRVVDGLEQSQPTDARRPERVR